jgi:hypothetical protein
MNNFAHLLRGFLVTAFVMIGVSQTANAVPRKLKRECRSDYKSLCSHYKVGMSRMRSCMRSNGSQLSWRCYQALKDHGYVSGRSGRSR